MYLFKELEHQGNWLFRYRGQLPVVLLFAGAAAYYYTVKGEFFNFTNDETWFLVCLATALFGQLIRAIVIGYTPKNTSGRNTKKQIAEKLNTEGIYSVVRHPLYLGNFFMWLGIAMITENAWFISVFILVYFIYYERIMYAEERFLYNKFGDEFKEWASKTPAIIPKFSKWKPCELEFSIKNILKREYNGFFSVFLIFFLFELERLYLLNKDLTFDNLKVILLIGSFIIFISLRTIKKQTKLLDDKRR